MTVLITKPAINLRETLASLRDQGGYQEEVFRFDNLVTNGDFASDTGWTKGTGWTITGGKQSLQMLLSTRLSHQPSSQLKLGKLT